MGSFFKKNWFYILGVTLAVAIVATITILCIRDWEGVESGFKDYLKMDTYVYVIVGILSTIIFSALIAYFAIKKSKESLEFSPVHKIAIVAIFTALSTVLMYFGIPFVLPFLKIEFSVVIAVAILFLVDYKSAIFITLLKCGLNYLLKGSGGVPYPIGEIAHFMAVAIFLTTIYIIYNIFAKRNQESKGIAVGCITAVFTTTIFMLILNYLWILPVYIDLYTADGFYASLDMEEPENFIGWLIVSFGTFNLVQWGIIAIASIIVYKKVVVPLRGKLSH